MIHWSAILGLLAAAVLPCAMGCNTLSGGGAVSIGQVSSYDSARLSYRLDAGKMGVPLSVSRFEGQQVSYQEVPSTPHTGRSVGMLDIQYPHPAGYEGMAMVGVVIHRKFEAKRGMVPNPMPWFRQLIRPASIFSVRSNQDLHEAWVLDIPKADLDQILAQLHTEGFYGEQTGNENKVRIITTIGGIRVRKNWGQVAALDALMHRVRTQGQLVSYQGISSPTGSAGGPPASIVALREHHQTAPQTLIAGAPGAQTSFAPPAVAHYPVAQMPAGIATPTGAQPPRLARPSTPIDPFLR